jgi:hypothetical protein
VRLQRLLPFALLALGLAAPAGAAKAPKLYPTDRCVSDKLRAAADVCGAALAAEAAFEGHQDQTRVDAALGKARTKLAKAWGRAEKRVAKQVDCAETSATSAVIAARIEEGAAVLANDVNDGLDLNDREDATCGRRILEAARTACTELLRAESFHLRQRTSDRLRLRVTADQSGALADLQEAVGAARNGCNTDTTTTEVAGRLDELVRDVVGLATMSPAVPNDSFEMITPEPVTYEGKELAPICIFDTPYVFFARRGTVNKLLVYYQGGGACWDALTCGVPICKTETGPGDNPGNATNGFANLTNPDNPFREWSVVMVPYCTGDVHWGDAAYDHGEPGSPFIAQHRGAVNAKVVEKWAREHFVMPEEVFVTGSSAGAYGAIASSPSLMESVWPSSSFAVLGDAGNGVITNEFLVNDIAKWGIEKNVPRWIKALDTPITDLSIVDVYVEVARQYPWNRFATYTTAHDGGSGGQGGFYNVMLTGGPFGALTWWDATCEWNSLMRAQNFEISTRSPGNFRSYVGTGSRHTMWGSNKVYADTTGGVPTLVAWVRAMIDGTPDWVDVLCTDCGVTLAGDPKPAALPTPPFDAAGNIVCPAP